MKRIYMSWGYRVIVILSVFVIGIITMVVIAVRQNIEMMDDHYYEKELQYQGIIDARKNLEKYNDSILVKTDGELVKITIPAAASQNITEGYLEFLRQSDKTKDKKVALVVSPEGEQLLPRSDFVKGMYRLRARWKSNGTEYYDERTIIVQ